MKFMKLLLFFLYYFIETHASTHWMVTEGGLIQPRLDSPFEMANPYDLLAFLNQDIRWDNIINIHLDLTKRQEIIKSLWAELSRDTDITTLLTLDNNCIKAGHLNLLEWYTSFLEDGKTKVGTEEFLLYNINYGDTEVPDCKKISSLTFSMSVFEHLEGMKQRENLSAKPELSLPDQVSPKMTVDQFGHWLAETLKKNSSSWLHYNMASLYWRVRGNAPKAMECSRRAVYYAPREYKDVALLNMGLILHRSKMTEDAIIILGAAADHDPEYPINHFVLANALAVIGSYNCSMKHFNICLKLNPAFDLAAKHKSGVLCHNYIMDKMSFVQEKLNQLRDELTQYIQREEQWLKSQTSFLRTMKHGEENENMSAEKSYEKISELTGLNIKEVKREGDKYFLIQHFLESTTYNEGLLKEKGVHVIEAAYSLKRLINQIGKHANMDSKFVIQENYEKLSDDNILKEIGPTPTFPDLISDLVKSNPFMKKDDIKPQPPIESVSKTAATEADMSEFTSGLILYPSSFKVSRTSQDFDRDAEWPSVRLCKETAKTFPDNLEAVYQVFLPWENKGIRLNSLLTNKIGVPVDLEHELPWHPPTCPVDKDAAVFTQKKAQKAQIVHEVIITEHLRQKLLYYVADGDPRSLRHMQDAEIGHRIYVAMQMKLAPKWLLYILSSLYWRVRGNNVNALHCAMTANKSVEPKYKDIILISLASIYLEMGYFDESLAAAEEAFKISLYEPATNFILAELNMLKKHRNTHMFHLKQVIRVEPNFMNGLARTLLYGWACLFKQVNVLQELELNEGDICTQVEPGMSMVCGKDGANCHLTNIQCFNPQERESSSTLVRLLELKENEVQGPNNVDDMSEHVFDHFVKNMPRDHADKIGHQRNYDAMMKTVDKALKGCGTRGCASIQPDDLALKEEDCTYQHLELGYWLHITSFSQLLSDSDSRLPSEILAMSPSNKKIPDCRVQMDPSEDFFLERLAKIDTEGWEPVLSLMHQFAEMFNFYDYVTLGAKIAKYVDTRPESWEAAVAAGWWCGASGRGGCAARCLTAARALAPHSRAPLAARALAALLHVQSKQRDAKDVAYLSFYAEPKSKIEAFLVAVSHTYLGEYEPAVWMYRYALLFDDKFLPAKACLHATMCLMLFGESTKAKTT